MAVSDDIAIFRKRPQRAKWYLAVHRPASLFSSQIAATPDTYPASAVTIDPGFNVGDATLASKNMTVWVGTLPGGSDEGRIRLREDISGNVLQIAESGSALNRYTAGLFVTVMNEFYPWPKLPRYISSASQWRMDYDESYTDELENYPPVIRMGPPLAGFIDSGSMAASFVGGSTQYITATPTAHEWVFPEQPKSNIIGTEASPIVRTFSSASPRGTYFTYVTTDSNGKSTSGHRLIYTFADRLDPARVEFAEISGGLKAGGYKGSIRAVAGANTDQFPDGAEILIFEEASYAGTASTIGGNYPFRSNVVLRGYILEDTTTINPFSGDVTFKFTTVDGYLDKTHSKDIFHKNAIPPTGTSEWIEAEYLNLDKVAIDWLHNRSTVGAITDFSLASGIAVEAKVAFQDLPKASLWKQIKTNYGEKGTLGYVASDMQGNIHAMEDVQISGLSAALAASQGFAIQQQDRRDVVTIAHPHHDKNALVELYSVAEPTYEESDTAGKEGYIGARSPGADAHGYFGGVKVHQRGLVVDDVPAPGQQTLTTWAGNLRAKLNSRYPKVVVPISGNYRFDSVPQRRVQMSLSPTENPRGIDWSNKNFLPYKTSLTYDSNTGTALTTLEMEETVDGKGGSAITFERIVPMNPQPTPTPTPLVFSGGSVFVFNIVNGVYQYYTDWSAVNGGLTGTNIQDRHGGRGGKILYKTDSSKIYKSEDYGTTWSDATPTADPTGSDASAVDYIRYKNDLTNTNNHYFLARNNIGGTWQSWLLHINSATSAETWQEIYGTGTTGTSVSYFPPTSAVFGGNSLSQSQWGSDTPDDTVAKFDSTHAMIIYHSADGNSEASGNLLTVTSGSIDSAPHEQVFTSRASGYSKVGVTNINSTQVVALAVSYSGDIGYTKAIQMENSSALSFLENDQRLSTADIDFPTMDGVGTDEVIYLWKNISTGVPEYRKGEISAGGSLTLRDTFDLPQAVGDAYDTLGIVSMDSTYAVAAGGVRHHDNGTLDTYLIELQGQSAVNYGPFVASPVNVRYQLDIANIGANKFAIVYYQYDSPTSAQKIIIGETTATSITFGAPQDVPSPINSDTYFRIARIQDNSLIHVIDNDGADAGVITTVATVTGTSVDFSPYSTGKLGTSNIDAYYPTIEMLDTQNALVGFIDDDYGGTSKNQVRAITGSLPGGQSATSALGLAIGNAGTKGYVTYHDGANLGINEYSLPTMAVGNQTSLGAATAGQVEANTYIAYPQIDKSSDSMCLVFGRMDSPAGIASTPTHVIKSEDAAATFTMVENRFGTDYVPMVLRRGVTTYAFRNVNNKICAIYAGSSGLGAPVGFLPWGIHNEAAHMSGTGYIIAGASEATADMVRYSVPPYSRWYRLDGYPDTGEVTGITMLSTKY